MKKKNILILGSTGSIGVNTLRVVDRYPDKFNIVGLSAYTNIKLLRSQIKKYRPSHIAVTDKARKILKSDGIAKQIKFFDVYEDIEALASLPQVDVVIIAMRGSAALKPFLSALQQGKIVAPANKEAIVIAGDILMKVAKKHNTKIIPIDSEQSAIFQCLEGRKRSELKKVFLTASGGSLLNVAKSKFSKITLRKVLSHPRWKMGKKITVDSATLMNKGFEIIEAKNLFSLNIKEIEVVIHPESIIHSMVEFRDGSIMAQLGVTDMRLPIQLALTYPERWDTGLKQMDFFQLKQLNFQKPDYQKFPSLALSMHAAQQGGTLPSVLNAADEEVVEGYLSGLVKFHEIYDIIEKVLKRHKCVPSPNLKQILEADQWAREESKKFIYN